MSYETEAAIVTILFLVAVLIPSVLIAWYVARRSKRISNTITRKAVKTFAFAFAFTPSVYPHGILLAWWVVLFGEDWLQRLTFGVLPIILVWLVCFAISLLWGRKQPVLPDTNVRS